MKRYAFIVLNLEKYWNRLCNQNKSGKLVHAFVRRGVVGPKNTKILFFYVTHPRKEIQGFADFIERITGDAEHLWKTLGHQSLLKSHKEYKDFLGGKKESHIHQIQEPTETTQPCPNKSNI